MGRAPREQGGDARDEILVVSASRVGRTHLVRALAALGPIGEVPDAPAARAAIDRASSPYRLLLVDLRSHSSGSCKAALRALTRRAPRTAVLVVADRRSLETAREAMHCAASDVLWAPFEDAELLRRCREIRGRDPVVSPARRATSEVPRAGVPALPPVAESEAMRRTVSLARRVAPMRSRVLLTGETGTGKEILAELIHTCSGVTGPLVRVNCAALPETLLESELFGHERGAFTGAERQRIGRFEQAHRGTLFLDEIGELSQSTQVKLLRVLQQREFQRLGGVATIQSDARVIAATNRDLPAAIRDGLFREDLYYRLNVVRIHIAALRDRRADIPKLAEHFVGEICADLGLDPKVLSPASTEALCARSWPGNVRQLRNALERAVITSRPGRIDVGDLFTDVSCGAEERAIGSAPAAVPSPFSLEAAERAVVVRALDSAGYVQKDAARLLGVSRRKLNYMIQRMGVTHPSWRRNRGPGAGVEEADAGAVLQTGPSDLY